MSETTENKTGFKWNKERTPSVTKCCSSLNWVCTEKGDWCYGCNIVTPDNLRTATALDLRLSGAYISDVMFEEIYEKA